MLLKKVDLTFFKRHCPVALLGRVEVALGLARLGQEEAVVDLLVGEASEKMRQK